MYDRPTLEELIDAVRMHLESAIIPAVREDRKLYFQTLVAINVLKIAGRELTMSGDHLRVAWARLNEVEQINLPLPNSDREIQSNLAQRNAALANRIRAGDYDAASAALFNHLKAAAVEQLQAANPGYLKKLMQEDENPALDAWHNR